MTRSEIEQQIEKVKDSLVERINQSPIGASFVSLLIGVFVGQNLKSSVLILSLAGIIVGVAALIGEKSCDNQASQKNGEDKDAASVSN